jgi:regulator of protease activity HflC (stomatin/prohibitin superfamily)
MVLTGDGYGIEVSQSAIQLKQDLLAETKAFTTVSSPAESNQARAFIGRLAEVRIAVEKRRKEVKEPVLDLGKKIDAAAKDYSGTLSDEESRITHLVGIYAERIEAERRKAEKERQDAERERLRLELIAEAKRKREEEEKAAQAAAAEAARIAAEEAQFNAASEEEEAEADKLKAFAEHEAMLMEKRQQDIAIAEAERQRAAEEASKIALETALTAKASAPVEGVKFEIDFEVTNLDELYQADSSLVTLTARRADILAVLKGQQAHGMKPGLPGIIVTQKAKISK